MPLNATERGLLNELLDRFTATDPPRPAMGDDFVVVRPTGVRGAGKERRYPKPIPRKLNPATGLYEGENGQGYAQRLSQTINPDTGATYFPADWLGSLSGVGRGGDSWPIVVDRRLHPEDWETQAEIDQRKRLDDGHRFSPN